MKALICYQDPDTKDGKTGAIENCPLKDEWNLVLQFPHGPRYGGSYDGQIDGAQQLKTFLKDVVSYFHSDYRVQISKGEQELDSGKTGPRCYPLMNIQITGHNEDGKEGVFDLIVMGELGERLLDLPGMIWQRDPTA